ncbi:UNVERIFIED_CONTAM: hypothetical protein RMT77_001724 [Armadillidium vulgare]
MEANNLLTIRKRNSRFKKKLNKKGGKNEDEENENYSYEKKGKSEIEIEEEDENEDQYKGKDEDDDEEEEEEEEEEHDDDSDDDDDSNDDDDEDDDSDDDDDSDNGDDGGDEVEEEKKKIFSGGNRLIIPLSDIENKLFTFLLKSIKNNAGKAFSRYIFLNVFDTRRIRENNNNNDSSTLSSSSSSSSSTIFDKEHYISAINHLIESKNEALLSFLTEEVENFFDVLRYYSQYQNQSIGQLVIKYFGYCSYKEDERSKPCFDSIKKQESTLFYKLKLSILDFFLKPLISIFELCGGRNNNAMTTMLLDIIIVRVLNNDLFFNEEGIEVAADKLLHSLLWDDIEAGGEIALNSLPPFDKNYEVNRFNEMKECLLDALMKIIDDDHRRPRSSKNVKKKKIKFLNFSPKQLLQYFTEKSNQKYCGGGSGKQRNSFLNIQHLSESHIVEMENIILNIVKLEVLGILCPGMFVSICKQLHRFLNVGHTFERFNRSLLEKKQQIIRKRNFTSSNSDRNIISVPQKKFASRIDSTTPFSSSSSSYSPHPPPSSSFSEGLEISITTSNDKYIYELLKEFEYRPQALKKLVLSIYDVATNLYRKSTSSSSSSQNVIFGNVTDGGGDDKTVQIIKKKYISQYDQEKLEKEIFIFIENFLKNKKNVALVDVDVDEDDGGDDNNKGRRDYRNISVSSSSSPSSLSSINFFADILHKLIYESEIIGTVKKMMQIFDYSSTKEIRSTTSTSPNTTTTPFVTITTDQMNIDNNNNIDDDNDIEEEDIDKYENFFVLYDDGFQNLLPIKTGSNGDLETMSFFIHSIDSDENKNIFRKIFNNNRNNKSERTNDVARNALKMNNNRRRPILKTETNSENMVFHYDESRNFISFYDGKSGKCYHVISIKNLKLKIKNNMETLEEKANAVCEFRYDPKTFLRYLEDIPYRRRHRRLNDENSKETRIYSAVVESYLKNVLFPKTNPGEIINNNNNNNNNNKPLSREEEKLYLKIFKFTKNCFGNLKLVLKLYSTLISILEILLTTTVHNSDNEYYYYYTFDVDFYNELLEPIGESLALISCSHFSSTVNEYLSKTPEFGENPHNKRKVDKETNSQQHFVSNKYPKTHRDDLIREQFKSPQNPVNNLRTFSSNQHYFDQLYNNIINSEKEKLSSSPPLKSFSPAERRGEKQQQPPPPPPPPPLMEDDENEMYYLNCLKENLNKQ